MIFTSRLYSGVADLQSILDLLVAVRPAERITDFPSVVDLRELLALPVVRDNTRLWFDADDRLIGFAFVDHYNNLCFESADPGIETEIVDWGGQCIRRAMQATGESLTLYASCCDDHTDRIATIHAKEYRRADDSEPPMGEGDVDFPPIIALARARAWPVIVEYESEPSLEGVAHSAAYLQALLEAE